MTTWTCKAPGLAVALAFLAGCDGVPGAALLNGLTGSSKDVALSQASMAFGTITLKPPRGFCIDKRTLQQQFAIMARCDTLGVPSAAGDAPLGIIIASFAPSVVNGPLPGPSITASALGLTDISDVSLSDDSVIFRASGGAPLDDTATQHWRATARVGDQIMGLALYGPEGGRAIGDDGNIMLRAVVETSGPTS